jgi:hypothetical protein
VVYIPLRHSRRLFGQQAARPQLGPRALFVIVILLGTAGMLSNCGKEDAPSEPGPAPLATPREFVDGVALTIVYDTSGSMLETVKDSSGAESPKYVIANRALVSVVDQLEAWTKGGSPESPRRLECALVRFEGKSAAVAIPMGTFAPEAFRDFAKSFQRPHGATPLGSAVDQAARAALASPMLHKHVIVISDGKNTDGPSPSSVLEAIDGLSRAQGTAVGAHFIAFDVDASVFGAVKQSGAGVVSASDEVELQGQLHDILENEVLLEVEDPPPASRR